MRDTGSRVEDGISPSGQGKLALPLHGVHLGSNDENLKCRQPAHRSTGTHRKVTEGRYVQGSRD